MGRVYRRRRHYSTRERMLVHLSSDGMDEAARLPGLTQEGIAESVLSGRSTVTKWLSRLERQGLLLGERGHVPAHRVRKMVYRLTPQGWDAARRLRDRLGEDIVEVRAPELGLLAIRVAEIPGLFPSRVDLTRAVSLVSQGRLDLTGLPESRAAARTPLVWGASLRRPDRVLGRSPELAALDAWQASAGRILAVVGLPGIGKTSLVAQWALDRRASGHVFWHELHESSTPATVLADLGAFLARIGRRGLAAYLSEPGRLDVGLAARTLEHSMRGLSVLLILDGVERASGDVARLVAALLPGIQASPSRLLVTSRTLPRFLSDLEAKGPDAAVVLRLKGLAPDASADLLRAKGMYADEATLARIASLTRGHPLLLSLAAQGGAVASGTIEHYLEREIWTSLADGERNALELASVLRAAMPLEAFQEFARLPESVLFGLRSKNLLEPTITGALGVHDVIREFVRSRLTTRRIQTLHARAARHFARLSTPEATLEALYHLLGAGRMRDAAKLLEARGNSLFDSVSIQAVESLLRGLHLEDLDPATASVFAEYRGDSLRISGSLGPARMQYAHAVRLCEEKALTARVPRLLRKLASIERTRSNYPKALGYLVEAQARLSEANDPAERVEILRELAFVQQAQGDFESAAAHLSESIDLATELSNPTAITRGIIALGTLEARLGHLERGLAYKLEGLRMAERTGNLTEIARGCIVVGTAYAEMKRYRDSLPYYDRGYRLAQLLGNLRFMAYAVMNKSAALIDVGQFDSAGPVLQEARGLFEIIGEPETLALLWIHEGNRELGLGHWPRAERAWERSLQELRRLGDDLDLARALKEVGNAYVDRGESEVGRAYLSEAEGIAARLGNHTLRAEIRARLDGIPSGMRSHDVMSADGP